MEHEITHEAAHDRDPFGKKIGVLAAVIGVFLVVVTIESHRAHTQAVIVRTEANDQWAFYQAKSLKRHTLEVGRDLLSVLPPSGKTAGIAERYSKEIERYGEETREIQDKANEKEAETALVEKQALRFDLGEGFLELGLVLASLYFLSRKKLFPVLGCISAAGGLVLAATGLFLH